MLLPLAWKRSPAAFSIAAAGGFLLWKAARGESPRESFSRRSARQITIHAVTIQASREEVYSAWRRLEDMSRYFPVLQEIRVLDSRRSQWKLRAGGREWTWEAEITEELPNERLVWQSGDASGMNQRGLLCLRDAPEGRGTILELTLEFSSPGGLAALLAPIGLHPGQLVREGLRRFKQWMEAGEIATIEGQPHGPRSAMQPMLQRFQPGLPPASEMPRRTPARRTGTI